MIYVRYLYIINIFFGMQIGFLFLRESLEEVCSYSRR